MRRGELRVATRGSDLALRQAGSVRERLAESKYDVELVEVSTRGDELRDELIHRLGRKGAFVRALDRRVLDGEVDAAVHSLKDVPTDFPEDLVVAAVPERATPGDLLVTPDGVDLADLPEGAAVGTSSLRRGATLLAERPDLTVEPLRGNVDTRVEKLLAPGLQAEHQRRVEAAEERAADADGQDSGGGSIDETTAGERDGDAGSDDSGTGDADGDGAGGSRDGVDGESGGDGERASGGEPGSEQTPEEWFESLSPLEQSAMGREVETEYDAIVLAAAGLERLGLRRHVGTVELDASTFVPAAGQGALAVTCRRGETADRLQRALDHPRSRVAVTAERVVLEELGGGCIAPIGVHAGLRGEYVHCRVRVSDRDGTEVVADDRDLPAEDYARAAREFAADLADRGAADLVAAAREE